MFPYPVQHCQNKEKKEEEKKRVSRTGIDRLHQQFLLSMFHSTWKLRGFQGSLILDQGRQRKKGQNLEKKLARLLARLRSGKGNEPSSPSRELTRARDATYILKPRAGFPCIYRRSTEAAGEEEDGQTTFAKRL